MRAPRSVARSAGWDRAGQGLGQDAAADDVDQVAVQPRRDPAAGQPPAPILTRWLSQVGDAVAVDDRGRPRPPCRPATRRLWPGRVPRAAAWPGGRAAAHLDRGQVLRVRAGRNRLDQLSADEYVHGVLVGPCNYAPAAPAPAWDISRAGWVRLIARTPQCGRQRTRGWGRHDFECGDLERDAVRRIVPARRARASEVQSRPGRRRRPGLQMHSVDRDPFGQIPDDNQN